MWRLWRGRRFATFKFRRQVPFRNHILDFVCFERKIVIEIDGGQHLESRRDRHRDATLAREGFRVLRYWKNDVLQQSMSVLEDIFTHLANDRCRPLTRRASELGFTRVRRFEVAEVGNTRLRLRATLSHKGRG
ncbi:MAG: endonuclease domain-containing protein [Xanthobacteraceae bacterium]